MVSLTRAQFFSRRGVFRQANDIAHLDTVRSDHGGQGEKARRRQDPKRLAGELHVVAVARGLPIGLCGGALAMRSLRDTVNEGGRQGGRKGSSSTGL